VLNHQLLYVSAHHSGIPQWPLQIEETTAILRAGQGAGFEAAEDAVSALRDHVVSRITEKSWQHLQKKCGWFIEASELPEDEENCVRAGEYEFSRMFGILSDDHVDRIQIARVKVMARQKARGKSALQRREAEYCIAVAANDEPD
jgi:hypothetical protein